MSANKQQPRLNFPHPLRPDQYRIAAHPTARFHWLAMGRRWGKSTLFGTVALMVANQGGKVAWCVPVYDNSKELFAWCKSVVAPLQQAKLVKVNHTDHLIEFTNTGGFLRIFSVDHDDLALRSWSFHHAFLDEAALMPESVFSETLLPCLSDYAAPCWAASTPKSYNWFFREWQAAKNDKSGESAAWTAPSSANPNPNIRADFERARRKLPSVKFRQEWMAEFVPSSESVITGVREARRVAVQHEAQPGHVYYLGIDLGRHHDATVIAVWDAVEQAIVHLTAVTDMGFAAQKEVIKKVYARFQPAGSLIERNNLGEQMSEDLIREGLRLTPWYTTMVSKNELCDAGIVAFQLGEFGIIDDEDFIAELEAFTGSPLSSGMYRYGAPAGYHDDRVIAAFLAHFASISTVEDQVVSWQDLFGYDIRERSRIGYD